LVLAKGHLFVRWDDEQGKVWSPGACFNIEATSDGLRCPPDEHYLTWPVPIEQKELASGLYVRPLEPNEEVGMFRSTRAICLWENGRYADALRECHLAVVLAPNAQCYAWQIMDLYKKYRAIMATKTPAEISETALTYEEEVQLQKNIVVGHHERLRRGLPGYNLAEFGIHPKPLPYGPQTKLIEHLSADPTSYSKGACAGWAPLGRPSRCTMTAGVAALTALGRAADRAGR
jgi:hypothetical protein